MADGLVLARRPTARLRLSITPGLGLLVPVALILFLQLGAALGLLPRYLVAPSAVASTWWKVLESGELPTNIASSLFRQVLGLAIGAFLGITAGLLAGVSRPVERFWDPLVSLLYPIPKVAVLPLIFAWFGLGSLSKIIVMVISIFFPTYISAFYGARTVNKHLLWSAESFGAGRMQIFFKIVLPSALPDIFSGLRIALALSFVLMVTTELVVATSGLGYMIGQAEDNLRFDRMYAAILTIGLIGFCADRALEAVRRKVIHGQVPGREHGR